VVWSGRDCVSQEHVRPSLVVVGGNKPPDPNGRELQLEPTKGREWAAAGEVPP